MTQIIVTEELLNHLYEGQKKHLIEVLQTHRNGDDGGDYITSALDCFCVLQEATCDQSDTEIVSKWLNTPLDEGETFLPIEGNVYFGHIVQLGHCASDGICQEIYDLNCIALEDK